MEAWSVCGLGKPFPRRQQGQGSSRHTGQHTRGLETGVNLGSRANLGKEEPAGRRMEQQTSPQESGQQLCCRSFKPTFLAPVVNIRN